MNPRFGRAAAGIMLAVCALAAVVVMALPRSAGLMRLQVQNVDFRFQRAGIFYGKGDHVFLGNPVLSRLRWFIAYRTPFRRLSRLFPRTTHGIEELGLSSTNRPVLYVTWFHKDVEAIVKKTGRPPAGPYSITSLACYLTGTNSSRIPLMSSSGQVSLNGDCAQWWPLPRRLTNLHGYTAHFVIVPTPAATTNDDVATLPLW